MSFNNLDDVMFNGSNSPISNKSIIKPLNNLS